MSDDFMVCAGDSRVAGVPLWVPVGLVLVRPHQALHVVHGGNLRGVASEDLGAGSHLVGEVWPELSDKLGVAGQGVCLREEGHVVGRPVARVQHTGLVTRSANVTTGKLEVAAQTFPRGVKNEEFDAVAGKFWSGEII